MRHLLFIGSLFLASIACSKEDTPTNKPVFLEPGTFVMGADLSYTNQLLDHGAFFIDSGRIKDPYSIFRERGLNTVRFRLFHDPEWTREIYGEEGSQMYHDLADVEKGIARARSLGMKICLDFHYSDTWADPAHQIVPEAWEGLPFDVLCDSLYDYTYNTLIRLAGKGLMPDYVQPGNEINPGILLPYGDRWKRPHDLHTLLQRACQAIRDAGKHSTIHPRIILHLAQPENVEPWMKITGIAGDIDYDILGFSYYYNWSTVPLHAIASTVQRFRSLYGKDVMIMETAYPWTLANADDTPNIVAPDRLAPGYPANRQGQLAYMTTLTRQVILGGGKGLFYWEPEWITSEMKISARRSGSAWDCNTFFDFGSHPLPVFRFMTTQYPFP